MSKYLLAAILCLSSIASFGTVKPQVKQAFKANVQIHQQTVTGEATCSATAIGPQALLTATHCEMPTDVLQVSTLDKPVHIVGRIRDGQDHTIYLIDGTLKDFVPVAQNKIDPTEHVFIWGNPGELNDMYREGVMSGIHQDSGIFTDGPLELYFDLNSFHGDSGAGIFNENGDLVEVVSFSLVQGKNNDIHRMTGAYPMDFKKEDLDKAVKFTTPKKDSDVNNSKPAAPSN